MVNRPKKQNVSIQQILTALLDDKTPFPPVFLRHFSDLEGPDLAALKSIWPQASPERRFLLLEDLEELAENDTLVSFENIARMALTDGDARVRTVAIRLLWESEDQNLVPIFQSILAEDPNPDTRAAAASGLGLFVYLGELEEIPEETLHQVEDQLIAVVNGQDNFQVRRRALESLGFSGRPEVPALIREAYEGNNLPWVESALFAMGRSADNTWNQEVLRMLNHPEASVQVEAIRAAGELGLESARRPLLRLLDDELLDADVRAATYWALSRIGGDDVREVLEARLEETEDEEDEELLEDALENLDFTEEMNLFEMFDLEDLPEEDESPEEYLARRLAPVVDEHGDRVQDDDDLTTPGDGSEEEQDPPKLDSNRKRHRPNRSN